MSVIRNLSIFVVAHFFPFNFWIILFHKKLWMYFMSILFSDMVITFFSWEGWVLWGCPVFQSWTPLCHIWPERQDPWCWGSLHHCRVWEVLFGDIMWVQFTGFFLFLLIYNLNEKWKLSKTTVHWCYFGCYFLSYVGSLISRVSVAQLNLSKLY